jgi:dolichol-phosphate mannosyltransferase
MTEYTTLRERSSDATVSAVALAAPATELELSIVVPTFDERGNIPELIKRLTHVLADVRWEIVVVDDDSPDHTAEEVRRLARSDTRVRCLQRIGRRGLSSACIEGMLATAAPAILVMDADLQHDERQIPLMLSHLRQTGADVVIASRYMAGGALRGWSRRRALMSNLATTLSRSVCRQDITDPMSGYFLISRGVLEMTVRRLSAIGFKILLDMVASSPRPLRIREIPYVFAPRLSGESKLDSAAMWTFFLLVLDKLGRGAIPVRFISYALVGSVGLLVHIAVLALAIETRHSFALAQTVATCSALVFNFTANNALTYRDRRLRGLRWLGGLASFSALCGAGAIANVGVAAYLFQRQSGWLLAGLAGVFVGALWNYLATRTYTWQVVE